MAELIKMPKLGFDMAEGVLIRWLKGEGDTVEKGEVLAEIETDKATVEVEARASGVIRKLLVEESTSVPVGDPIAVVGDAQEEIDLDALIGESASEEKAKPEAAAQPGPAAEEKQAAPREAAKLEEDGRIKASPLARRLAEDHGIDLARMQGSGPGGRIVKKDVEGEMAAQEGAAPPAQRPQIPAGEVVREPLSKLRATIGRRMTQSKQQVPHFYLTAEMDAGPMMALRAQINETLPKGEKLSVNDFIVKACALALREFPNLNATLDGDEILRIGEVNIGIAVAVEGGLLTVVVPNADTLRLREISKMAGEMSGRARQGRVRPSDVEGSTFTISNLGMYAIDDFIAIINPPEAGILAVGAVRDQPVVEGESIRVGKRVKFTISADHRVTDGAEAAEFMQVFRRYIEQPVRLLSY
jgi:pyruvate dehydrogenase E2 component (dihydrolipoamide acetyltransferase)